MKLLFSFFLIATSHLSTTPLFSNYDTLWENLLHPRELIDNTTGQFDIREHYPEILKEYADQFVADNNLPAYSTAELDPFGRIIIKWNTHNDLEAFKSTRGDLLRLVNMSGITVRNFEYIHVEILPEAAPKIEMRWTWYRGQPRFTRPIRRRLETYILRESFQEMDNRLGLGDRQLVARPYPFPYPLPAE